MGAVKDEDPGSLHSDEEEDGDHSGDEGTGSERDATGENAGSDPEASSESHGPNPTARGSNLDRGGQKETAVPRLSPADEPEEESGRSSTGSGAPSVMRSVSVETGLRNLKVSEGDAPEKGERTSIMPLVKARAPRPGISVVCVCSNALRSTPLDSRTPGDDRGSKVEAADPESEQDLDDDSTDDEEGTGRQVTSSRIKERVATEVVKDRNRQRKYHAKKSAQRSKGGRAKGSKAKHSVKQQVGSAGWF